MAEDITVDILKQKSSYKMLFGTDPAEIHMHPDDFEELCKSAEKSTGNKGKSKKKKVTLEDIDTIYGMKAFQSFEVPKRKFHFEPTNHQPVMSLGVGQPTNITLSNGMKVTAIPIQQVRKGMKVSIAPSELRPVVEDVLRQIAHEEMHRQHIEKEKITKWQRIKMWAREQKL